MKSVNKYKEFCLYFEELRKKGINYSLSDMWEKADELGLPVSSVENGKIKWRKFVKEG